MVRVKWLTQPPNYGDMLTPLLLKHYGVPHVFDRRGYNTLCVGSIAGMAKPGTRLLGSGFMRHADPVERLAKWGWVRGPLSAEKVRKETGKTPEVLGDPAWLLPRFVKPSERTATLGIAPHHVDFMHVRSLKTGLPVVDLLDLPSKVTSAITRFDRIITSSLHGLIVAHAYGIPAALVKFGDRLKGDGFKFEDYANSVGLSGLFSTFDDPVFTLPKSSLDSDAMEKALWACR